jgi:hypothetical protein
MHVVAFGLNLTESVPTLAWDGAKLAAYDVSGDGSDGTFVANTSRSVRSHTFSGWGPARCPICIPPAPVPRWASRTLRAICSRPIGIAPMARPRCWLQILPRELYLRPAIDVVLTMRSSIRPAESISSELASIAPHGAGFCHPIRSVLVPIRISMHMSEPGQPPMRIRAAYRRSKTRPQKRRPTAPRRTRAERVLSRPISGGDNIRQP